MQKRIVIFLLCSVVTVSLIVFAVSVVNQKTRTEPRMKPRVYTEQHKNEWLSLLANNDEVLPYLEQLYTIEDELLISYRNSELAINESALNMFSPHELKILEDFFQKFQWETIRLRQQENPEQKMLEVISSQMNFDEYFCTAVIVYSPNEKLDGGEEIFSDWYYKMYFET